MRLGKMTCWGMASPRCHSRRRVPGTDRTHLRAGTRCEGRVGVVSGVRGLGGRLRCRVVPLAAVPVAEAEAATVAGGGDLDGGAIPAGDGGDPARVEGEAGPEVEVLEDELPGPGVPCGARGVYFGHVVVLADGVRTDVHADRVEPPARRQGHEIGRVEAVAAMEQGEAVDFEDVAVGLVRGGIEHRDRRYRDVADGEAFVVVEDAAAFGRVTGAVGHGDTGGRADHRARGAMAERRQREGIGVVAVFVCQQGGGDCGQIVGGAGGGDSADPVGRVGRADEGVDQQGGLGALDDVTRAAEIPEGERAVADARAADDGGEVGGRRDGADHRVTLLGMLMTGPQHRRQGYYSRVERKVWGLACP